MSWTIAPYFGSVLSDPRIVSWFSYATPFLAVGISFLFCALLLTVLKFETIKIEKNHKIASAIFKDLLKALHVPKITPLLFISVFSMLGWMTYQGFMSPYLDQKYGFSEEWIAKAFTSFCTWWLIGGILANQWLLKKYLPSRVNLLPMLATPLFVLSYLFFSHSTGMWYASALANLAESIAVACFFSLFAILAPTSIQGKIFGFWNAGFALCSGLGPLFAGFLAGFNIDFPFFAAFVILLLAAFFYLKWYVRHQHLLK